MLMYQNEWKFTSGTKNSKQTKIYLHSFIIFSSWKRAWSFIWTNLNPLHPRLLWRRRRRRRRTSGQMFTFSSEKFWVGGTCIAPPFHMGLIKSYSWDTCKPLNRPLDLSIKLKSPSPKDALCQVWLKLVPVVLKKKMKMWNVYWQRDGRQALRKAHLSFQLRWANKWGKRWKLKSAVHIQKCINLYME